MTTPSPEEGALVDGRRHRRELAVGREVLPMLHGVLSQDADVSDLLRRTGLLALGKLAQDETDTALLVAWLHRAEAPLPVREAAALGLGLLRRSDPARTFDATLLDTVRLHLLRRTEDEPTPDALKATCALSLGLLGDQPFGAGIHQDGRLVTHRLWQALARNRAGKDLPVALLTALGMQPRAGVPDGVREALTSGVYGRPVQGRRWDDVERSHALMALARLEGTPAWHTLENALTARRMPVELRRAALIATGYLAPHLDAEDRRAAAGAVEIAHRTASDPLTRGLAHVAVGYLAHEDLLRDGVLVHDAASGWRRLLTEARSGTGPARGFAVMGLGLALRPADVDAEARAGLRRARDEGEAALLEGLREMRGDAEMRGAFAVALGLMRSTAAVPTLIARVEDADESEIVRSDAAVALGQIGHPGKEVVRALHLALADRRRPRAQSGAALGLSLLQGYGSTAGLLRELDRAATSEDVRRLTEPLGHLGDPALVGPLVAYVASAEHADYPRAHVIVALGNLGDPEPRPSLAWLGRDANYPAAPPALKDAIFTR